MKIHPWKCADVIVTAVGDREERLTEAISDAAPHRVADLLAGEIEYRCQPFTGAGQAVVNLLLRFGQDEFRYVVSFDGNQVRVGPGGSPDALAEISYSLTDLARSLYPPHKNYESISREVRVLRWPWSGTSHEQVDEMIKRGNTTPEEIGRLAKARFNALERAVHSVITACSASRDTLSDLSVRYGSDKWGALHWYTQHYQYHFSPIRYEPVRVLEIGIGGYGDESSGGESLHMWQQFFPRGLIYGLDIVAKPHVAGPRIRTVQGDQNDPSFLHELGSAAGPFDIVIDDGSHINEHVRTSFETLFQYVRPGGWYVIEDLHTAYWPAFGGEASPRSRSTTVGLLADMLDQLHECEYLDPADPDLLDPVHPSQIVVYHNLALLRRAVVREEGVPEWLRKRVSGLTRSRS